MKLRVQVVIECDDDDDHQSPAVHEVAQIDRDTLSVDTLGLHLEGAKNLLQKMQTILIDEQVRTSLAEQVACPDCGRPRAHKDTKDDCHSHAVRHPAPAQSALASVSVSAADDAHVQSAGRGAARAHHP